MCGDSFGVMAGVVLLVASVASGDIGGPLFPPPGDVTAVSEGKGPAFEGGRTWTYTGHASQDIAAGLYYGKWSEVAIAASMNGDPDGDENAIEASEVLQFAGFDGNEATWIGEAEAFVSDGKGFPATGVQTRFRMLVSTLDGSPIPFLDPASIDESFPAGADAVIEVSGDFRATWFFEARLDEADPWEPLNPFYNDLQTPPDGPGTRTVSAAAYYINTPCNAADFSPPLGQLDIADVTAFLQLFESGDPAADLAAPMGVFDIGDIIAFLQTFGSGCP